MLSSGLSAQFHPVRDQTPAKAAPKNLASSLFQLKPKLHAILLIYPLFNIKVPLKSTYF